MVLEDLHCCSCCRCCWKADGVVQLRYSLFSFSAACFIFCECFPPLVLSAGLYYESLSIGLCKENESTVSWSRDFFVLFLCKMVIVLMQIDT